MNTTIFGQPEPLYNPDNIQQAYMDTCAIKSQQLILETFGIDASENALAQEALTMGWYTPGAGTPQSDVGKLLELHGVETTVFDGANQYTLINELSQGHQVIVGLDCNELWEPSLWERLMDFLGLSGANHAVIVSNVDASDPSNIMVQVTDPGNGTISSYPWDVFQDAWADSHFHMVATNDPVPAQGAFFESLGGRLDNIMGQSAEEWLGSFGELIQTGCELTSKVVDYVHEHPELIDAVMDVGTVLAPIILAQAGSDLPAFPPESDFTPCGTVDTIGTATVVSDDFTTADGSLL